MNGVTKQRKSAAIVVLSVHFILLNPEFFYAVYICMNRQFNDPTETDPSKLVEHCIPSCLLLHLTDMLGPTFPQPSEICRAEAWSQRMYE